MKKYLQYLKENPDDLWIQGESDDYAFVITSDYKIWTRKQIDINQKLREKNSYIKKENNDLYVATKYDDEEYEHKIKYNDTHSMLIEMLGGDYVYDKNIHGKPIIALGRFQDNKISFWRNRYNIKTELATMIDILNKISEKWELIQYENSKYLSLKTWNELFPIDEYQTLTKNQKVDVDNAVASLDEKGFKLVYDNFNKTNLDISFQMYIANIFAKVSEEDLEMLEYKKYLIELDKENIHVMTPIEKKQYNQLQKEYNELLARIFPNNIKQKIKQKPKYNLSTQQGQLKHKYTLGDSVNKKYLNYLKEDYEGLISKYVKSFNLDINYYDIDPDDLYRGGEGYDYVFIVDENYKIYTRNDIDETEFTRDEWDNYEDTHGDLYNILNGNPMENTISDDIVNVKGVPVIAMGRIDEYDCEIWKNRYGEELYDNFPLFLKVCKKIYEKYNKIHDFHLEGYGSVIDYRTLNAIKNPDKWQDIPDTYNFNLVYIIWLELKEQFPISFDDFAMKLKENDKLVNKLKFDVNAILKINNVLNNKNDNRYTKDAILKELNLYINDIAEILDKPIPEMKAKKEISEENKKKIENIKNQIRNLQKDLHIMTPDEKQQVKNKVLQLYKQLKQLSNGTIDKPKYKKQQYNLATPQGQLKHKYTLGDSVDKKYLKYLAYLKEDYEKIEEQYRNKFDLYDGYYNNDADDLFEGGEGYDYAFIVDEKYNIWTRYDINTEYEYEEEYRDTHSQLYNMLNNKPLDNRIYENDLNIQGIPVIAMGRYDNEDCELYQNRYGESLSDNIPRFLKVCKKIYEIYDNIHDFHLERYKCKIDYRVLNEIKNPDKWTDIPENYNFNLVYVMWLELKEQFPMSFDEFAMKLKNTFDEVEYRLNSIRKLKDELERYDTETKHEFTKERLEEELNMHLGDIAEILDKPIPEMEIKKEIPEENKKKIENIKNQIMNLQKDLHLMTPSQKQQVKIKVSKLYKQIKQLSNGTISEPKRNYKKSIYNMPQSMADRVLDRASVQHDKSKNIL